MARRRAVTTAPAVRTPSCSWPPPARSTARPSSGGEFPPRDSEHHPGLSPLPGAQNSRSDSTQLETQE